MKICIFGAGAIGGYMGAKLAQAGAEVSLVARGPHLAAMREKGLTLIEEDGTTTVPVRASDNAADLGPQDYVIVTLKAHSVPPVVAKMQPLIGPETTIVSGVNGVPWWYFHKIGGPLEGTRLASVDPGDAQWNGFGPDRVLGCVVYPAAEVIEPAIRKIREKADGGTINMNTNGSLPDVLDRLFDAGLDSIRVSMNSLRKPCYNAYFRPRGYRFEDVLESISLGLDRGRHVAINYLNMSGFTDAPEEAETHR